jgi:ATP-dependent helicase/nuclease subunit A
MVRFHPVNLKVLVEADQEHSDLTGSEQEAHFIVEQVKDILEHQKVYDMKTGTINMEWNIFIFKGLL